MRIVPTPARARREASAEPVAPQPTIVTLEAMSLRWPSTPIPRKSTCREYRSSSSKGITSFTSTNHYDRVRVVFKTELSRTQENFRVLKKEYRSRPTAEYNIALQGFIELINQLHLIGEPVCN
jgi:hypothetical protein